MQQHGIPPGSKMAVVNITHEMASRLGLPLVLDLYEYSANSENINKRKAKIKKRETEVRNTYSYVNATTNFTRPYCELSSRS